MIYEETKTFDENILIEQIKNLEFDENVFENQSYQKIREKLFLPVDELVQYFSKKTEQPNYLKRLVLKQNSKINKEIYNPQLQLDDNGFQFILLPFPLPSRPW